MSSLSYLRWRKSSVQSQIQSNRTLISDAEDKISRLRQALNEISTSLSDLQSIKSSINSLTIDLNSWRGKTEDEFDKIYSRYKDSVKTYISKVDDAKEAINDDIRRYEAEKSSYQSSITSLQHSLNSLNWQISQAEKELR